MYGAGRGRVDCWGAGAEVDLVLSKLKLDPRPAVTRPGAGGPVSVDKRVTSNVSCRKGYWPATLLL